MGFEVVLGVLIAWAVGKARRAGQSLDGVVDEVIDAGAVKARAKVLEVVLGKVGDDSAIQKLEEEVGASGEVSDLTRTRVELAVTAAERDDEQFAAALNTAVQAALAEAQARGGPVVASQGGTVITGTATSTGSGDAFGAVGNVTKVHTPDPQLPGRA